jgi:hypothetical protein
MKKKQRTKRRPVRWRHATTVLVAGEALPVLLPADDYTRAGWDHRRFDRAAVASGLAAFIRPASPADWPAGLPGPRPTEKWILVQRVGPDARARFGVDVYLPPDPQRN